jgi:hypothetical protein
MSEEDPPDTSLKFRVRSVALRDDLGLKLGKQKRKANAMERKTAKQFSGKRQPGSGSGMFNKGDVKCAEILIDDKFTSKKSFSLKQEDIAKICVEAMQERMRTPVLKIRFEAPIEEMENFPKEWVVMPAEFLRELLSERRDS